MSSGTNYIESAILNCLLRGEPMPTYPKTYVALFTANPGEAGAQANEISTAAFPAYVRREAEQGGAIGSGWSQSANGSPSSNLQQIAFPSHNGVSAITVTHYAIMDAATDGNMLAYAPLTTERTILPGDLVVFDVGTIVFSAD